MIGTPDDPAPPARRLEDPPVLPSDRPAHPDQSDQSDPPADPKTSGRRGRPFPRRAMLAASGTAVLAVAAACSSGTSGSGTTSTAGSPTTSGAAASSSKPATSSGAPSPAASAAGPAPTGTPLASVADVQSAGSIVVQSESGPMLLAYADGTVVAHTAICTHQQCTIAGSGTCPCHGSKYNVATGAVENGPALRTLAREPVTVSGGRVYLG